MARFTPVAMDPEEAASSGALDRGLRCRFGSADVPSWMEGDILTRGPRSQEVRTIGGASE
jgi:hypothetical protein